MEQESIGRQPDNTNRHAPRQDYHKNCNYGCKGAWASNGRSRSLSLNHSHKKNLCFKL
jgi:hypothetical protein